MAGTTRPRVLWRAKLIASLIILAYYLLGYFSLNRLSLGLWWVIPRTPADQLPVIPWTITVYHSVFVLAPLAIWWQASFRSLRTYTIAVLFSYTLNFALFAAFPSLIYRPWPQEPSWWDWAIELTRAADRPTTCFPSLHMTNCFVAVFSYRGTRFGKVLWVWSLLIAASTLTTGQHVFLDLPAGALTALLGTWMAERVGRDLSDAPGHDVSRPGDLS